MQSTRRPHNCRLSLSRDELIGHHYAILAIYGIFCSILLLLNLLRSVMTAVFIHALCAQVACQVFVTVSAFYLALAVRCCMSNSTQSIYG